MPLATSQAMSSGAFSPSTRRRPFFLCSGPSTSSICTLDAEQIAIETQSFPFFSFCLCTKQSRGWSLLSLVYNFLVVYLCFPSPGALDWFLFLVRLSVGRCSWAWHYICLWQCCGNKRSVAVDPIASVRSSVCICARSPSASGGSPCTVLCLSQLRDTTKSILHKLKSPETKKQETLSKHVVVVMCCSLCLEAQMNPMANTRTQCPKVPALRHRTLSGLWPRMNSSRGFP